MLKIYADESCHTAHRYLVLGGVAVEEENEKLALLKFNDIRHVHLTWGEAKWEKISKAKFPFYEQYTRTFFDLNAKDILHFHALCVDTRQFARGHNPEISFSKLIYQLLLHKFGRKYGKEHKLHVYLDKRTTTQAPDFMIPMLNADLRRYGILDDPFETIEFVDSGKSELIQANDLLIGAIGSRKNGHHLKPDASKPRTAIGDLIASSARKTAPIPLLVTSRFATRFSLWNFTYKKKQTDLLA